MSPAFGLHSVGSAEPTHNGHAKPLPAYGIVQRAKQDVGYDDPVHKTGILIPRETLTQVQQLVGSKYGIQSDADLLRVVENRGEELLHELRERLE